MSASCDKRQGTKQRLHVPAVRKGFERVLSCSGQASPNAAVRYRIKSLSAAPALLLVVFTLHTGNWTVSSCTLWQACP